MLTMQAWRVLKMNKKNIKKFKVIFEQSSEPFEQAIADALVTQLMVTICRVGLSADRSNKDAIIKKEKENGS